MIFVSQHDYKTRKSVIQSYPMAAVIKKVCGGWAVFDTGSDYAMWRRQK